MSDEIRDPEAVLAALERAKSDAKTAREALEAGKEEMEALRAEVNKYRSDITDTKLRRAIADAGADPDRVLRYLNKDGITLKEDGNLEGFDTEFARVKEDLPELFDAKRRVGGVVEMFPKGEPKQEKSVSEMQVDRLLRRAH